MSKRWILEVHNIFILFFSYLHVSYRQHTAVHGKEVYTLLNCSSISMAWLNCMYVHYSRIHGNYNFKNDSTIHCECAVTFFCENVQFYVIWCNLIQFVALIKYNLFWSVSFNLLLFIIQRFSNSCKLFLKSFVLHFSASDFSKRTLQSSTMDLALQRFLPKWS